MPKKQLIDLYCEGIYDNDDEQAYELIFHFKNSQDIQAVANINNYDMSKSDPTASLIIIFVPYTNLPTSKLPEEDNWYTFPLDIFKNLQENIIYTDNRLIMFQLKEV